MSTKKKKKIAAAYASVKETTAEKTQLGGFGLGKSFNNLRSSFPPEINGNFIRRPERIL